MQGVDDERERVLGETALSPVRQEIFVTAPLLNYGDKTGNPYHISTYALRKTPP